jgi:N-acetylglutamate synthase-like GNAT family acetyltransferase
MESDEFRLKDALPDLGLQDRKYGEISRVAVANSYRKGNLSLKILLKLIEQAIELECVHIFATSKYQV